MGQNFQGRTHSEATPPLGGRYQIVEQLGVGGFSTTFLAQDLHMPGRPQCVVKQLQPEINSDQELQIARRLFETEANVLSQLGEYPQIPRLLAHFEENQEFYLAQELIIGQDLQDELALGANNWSDAQAIAFLSDILSTLAFVHNHRVIHRDLKPANLIRRSQDNRIVLIDFGAVKQVHSQLGHAPSSMGRTIAIGTQGYMPIEQISGRPQFSSDLYAVGMIAIQALTGRYPNTLGLHPETGELDWHALAPNAHPALVALIDTLVRYDFRARYANATAAFAALKSLPAELSQFITSGVGPSAENTGRSMPKPSDSMPPSPPLQYRSEQASPAPTAAHTVAIGGQERPQGKPSEPAFQPSSEEDAVPSKSSSASRSLLLPIGIGLGSVLLLALGAITWQQMTDSPNVIITEPPVTEPPIIEEEVQILQPEAAIFAVETFYNHLSNKDWTAARASFGDELAQQFRPAFFEKFQQVTVENLRVTNQTTETVDLIGENVYLYPDDSTQREERTFTLQLIDGQPRIVESAFVRITKRR
ncbi:MAG: serine/threonine-protein kinase [Cyanobacteria bacterium P01_F01_bin.86]